VKLGQGSVVELRGNVVFQSDLGERGSTKIKLGRGAKLTVLGDFVIGPNVTIVVSGGGELIIGGRQKSSGSGITSSTKILVRERVEIGADVIIAWNVFITDCDWHTIEGRTSTLPTVIGSHVWLVYSSSVLKGACVGSGSIVMSQAVCSMETYPENALLGGAPAKVIRQEVVWRSELE
jgi:acetyltransferase-like isoleucine patch superfamily enzyme